MSRNVIAILVWCALNGIAFANSSLTTKVSRIDGLPARLLKVGGIDRLIKADVKSVDLAPALAALGCQFEEGESAFYHAPSGSLVRNLSQQNHELVDRIVDGLYRTDNLLATLRVYVDLMEPLSGDERLKVLRRVGFLPDPLVASMAGESSLEVSDKDRQEIDRKTLALLNIALDRMKRQIAVMEIPRTEQAAPSDGAKLPK
ncbi:MAG: hypothetical protein NTW21_00090 [Verrucomicrobia bacterium]|nr:hypothetical protein [Verrucomicrobiota bacterium]